LAFRNVAADRGVRWLVDAVGLIATNPQPFLLMGAVIGALAVLPLLGPLLLGIFGPALYAGIVHAAREQAAGRSARFEHLFTAFNVPGKLPKLLLLAVPGIAAGIVLAVLLAVAIGGALVNAGDDPAQVAAALGEGAPIVLLLALPIGLLSYALVFFAVPRVMLDDAEPFTAIGESLRACIGNAGAFLLFVASLFAGAMLLSLLLAWMPTLLGQLVLMSLLTPIVSTALLFAHRDVFGGDAGRDMPPPPVFEA